MPPPLNEMPSRVPSGGSSSYSKAVVGGRSASSDIRLLVRRARPVGVDRPRLPRGEPVDRALVEPAAHEQRMHADLVAVLHPAHVVREGVGELADDVALIRLVAG